MMLIGFLLMHMIVRMGVVCDIKVHREKEIFEPMSEVYRTCCSALRVVRDKVNKGLIEQYATKLVYWV